jgi:4-hydroxythreonine-4-phosphate dehydrogenase
MGDPAGIGPEISLKAVGYRQESSRHIATDHPLVLFGDANVLERVSRAANLSIPPVAHDLDTAVAIAAKRGASVLHLKSLERDWSPGAVSKETGKASYEYITHAIEAAQAGVIQAIVTGPIHKEALRMSGVPYAGHTEIFNALANRDWREREACMMLTSDQLTCSFVTTHIGFRDVLNQITSERILSVIELTWEAVNKIKRCTPRLAVCGLNPHAGENGLFGAGEEESIIAPALELAKKRGMDVTGPLPPDTAFLPSRRAVTDAFICMYHDQGHIPLKALCFDTAVNVTLGIPIVRTSVDHGTALDIAWKSFNADVSSMLHAIRLASQLIAPSISTFQGAIRCN